MKLFLSLLKKKKIKQKVDLICNKLNIFLFFWSLIFVLIYVALNESTKVCRDYLDNAWVKCSYQWVVIEKTVSFANSS